MQKSVRVPGVAPVSPAALWRVSVGADASLVEDVLRGLQSTPKRLSPTYFYDERGSQLFEEICQLPEYYITRTETAILQRHASEIARRIGENAMLVELGSGASTKTRLLLDHLPDLAAYVPVDISRAHLLAAVGRISSAYPHLEVLPACADFTQPFALPKPRRAPRRVVVLRRLNRELEANFDLRAFRHLAVWAPRESRIEMRLVGERAQTVSVAGEVISFDAEEAIITEYCHKYTPELFARQARAAGWVARQTWADPDNYFHVQYLEREPGLERDLGRPQTG